ncbi:fumarylacetoacetate hydrolase family protein [Planomonospora alba]|uniref:fumarylacetoacetate hydrolase family protein n=1 Tax=Planomonospora alba TaxID=161354 RepID=UPI0031E532F3
MRIARFSTGDGVGFGVVEGGPGEEFVSAISGHPFGPIQFTGERHALTDVKLLAPMLPSKVVAIGRNYAEHAREMGGEVPEEPLFFLKPSTSVIGTGDAIAYPVGLSQRVDYEGELAVVIGRLCHQVPVERAHEVVFGYTCANDVTARDLQKKDVQFTRAKGFDTFCPLGPWIQTELDPADLGITTKVNGEVRQSSRTSKLMYDIPALIAHVSAVMTLIPGDVILTGTPEGVGPLEIGDEVSVGIEGIGTLSNVVVSR